MLTKCGQGNGGVEKQKSKQTKNPNARNFEFSAGRLRMHEIDLEFLLKNELSPPKNGGIAYYNYLCAILYLLLCYACCYANAIDYELVYNGIRGGYFEYLELVEVDGSCLA